MSASSAIVAARVRAATRMVDSCSISRNGSGIDPTTGMPNGATSPVYSGACFLAEIRLVNASNTDVGGDKPISGTYTLKRPSGSTPVQVGDVVVMTGSSDPDHAWVTGLRLRVTVFNPASQKKSMDCQVQAIVG